jgi:hypothetical protein
MDDLKLRKEDAEELHILLNKLNSEMSERLENGNYDGELYTIIVRRKYERYLEKVYGVEI